MGAALAVLFDQEGCVLSVIAHCGRNGHLLRGKRRAVDQHPGDCLGMGRLVRPDGQAHSTSLWMKSRHSHPASVTALEIPTPGDISGFGFTSKTRGQPQR